MPKQLKFIDQARIFVKAGDGGDGIVGFYRGKYIPKGGPDGGDGGRGGDVTLVGSIHVTTLTQFQFKRHFKAKDGGKGGSNQRTGRDGDSVELAVPLGTIARDDDGNLIGEVTKNEERLVLQAGGKGGLGNVHFKSSTNQTPRKFIPGEVREPVWFRLELRLLADIGFVGAPNAGKSTLLGALTAARPKVADYPFTTLNPCLGVLQTKSGPIILADIPGLIEGAHAGAGLGHEFLRHIERTSLLLFVVAADPKNPDSALKDFLTTRAELEQYDVGLLSRPTLVALNKTDLLTAPQIRDNVKRIQRQKVKVISISAKAGQGLDDLISKLHESHFTHRK